MDLDLSQAVKVETVFDGVIPDKYYIFPNGGYHYYSQIPEEHDIGIYREKIWPYVVCVSNGVIHTNHQYGTLDQKGYVAVRLDKNVEKRPTYSKVRKKYRSVRPQFYVMMHRLVAAAFIPNHNPNEQVLVHHKNECKCDFRIENLDWVTHKENSIDGSKGKKVDPLERFNYWSKKDWFIQ